MEQAPTPQNFEKFKKANLNFKLNKEEISDKNKKFIISFEALSSEEIAIKAIHKDIINHIYENIFKVDDIKENKYFIQFDDLKEICEELKGRINKEKITIIESTNSIIISIPLPSSKIKEIIFELPEKEIENKETVNSLVQIIQQQKEEIANMKKEIEEIKTQFSFLSNCFITNLDSIIITEINNNSILKNWINPKIKIRANLLYRLSRDSAEISAYHNLCDNKGPTLHLFLLKMGDTVGFFVNESIDSISGWKKDDKCFVFNLSKKIKCKKKFLCDSFLCSSDCGPSANGLGCNSKEPLNYIYHSADMINKVFYNYPSKLLPSEEKETKYEVEECEVFQIQM